MENIGFRRKMNDQVGSKINPNDAELVVEIEYIN